MYLTKRHADLYRVAFRKMLALNGERTLVSTLLAPSLAHVFTIESCAFREEEHLLNLHALSISLPYDFFVKASGRNDFQSSALTGLPWAEVDDAALHRSLRLACLTVKYSDLWNKHAGGLKVCCHGLFLIRGYQRKAQ